MRVVVRAALRQWADVALLHFLDDVVVLVQVLALEAVDAAKEPQGNSCISAHCSRPVLALSPPRDALFPGVVAEQARCRNEQHGKVELGAGEQDREDLVERHGVGVEADQCKAAD